MTPQEAKTLEQVREALQQELKSCPFCGAVPNSGCNYGIGGAYVNCVNTKCPCNPEVFVPAVHNPDASLSLEDALAKAKFAWNTRTAGHVATQGDVASRAIELCRKIAVPYTGNPDDISLEEVVTEARTIAAMREALLGGATTGNKVAIADAPLPSLASDWTCPDCCKQPCECKLGPDNTSRPIQSDCKLNTSPTIPDAEFEMQTALRNMAENHACSEIWLPIESAPHDGTVILGDYSLAEVGDDVHTVLYMKDWHGEGKGQWRDSINSADWSEPKRWMPLSVNGGDALTRKDRGCAGSPVRQEAASVVPTSPSLLKPVMSKPLSLDKFIRAAAPEWDKLSEEQKKLSIQSTKDGFDAAGVPYVD